MNMYLNYPIFAFTTPFTPIPVVITTTDERGTH